MIYIYLSDILRILHNYQTSCFKFNYIRHNYIARDQLDYFNELLIKSAIMVA